MAFFEDENPAYIPKLMDGKISEWDIQIKYSLIELSHLKWRPGILDPIRESSEKLLIDPVTHKNFFADSKERSSYKKIGYPEIEPEILYSEKRIRRKFIEISIQEQIEAGADALVAPYMFSPDTDDIKFTTNLTLLSETLIYLEEESIDLPLFAKLFVGLSVLTRKPQINHIFSRYCDDYFKKIEGLILSINDFDGKKSDVNHLLGYANLVHLVQSKMKVICAPVGDFGEPLLAVGASGFGSSIHIGETASTNLLQEGSGGNGGIHERIYIPEIMGYLNYEEARLIEYKSTIADCEIDFTRADPDSDNKNKHYLLSKFEIMSSLSNKTRGEKITSMIERVKEAQNTFQGYISTHGWQLNTQHLTRWIDVLEKAGTWSDPVDDEEELKDLLEEIDKQND